MMPLRNTGARFGPVAIALHRLVATLAMFMLGLGWTMEDLPPGAETLRLYALHGSVDLSAFALTAGRPAWKAANPAPKPLGPENRWRTALSRGARAGLYAVLLAMPPIGWIGASAADVPVS